MSIDQSPEQDALICGVTRKQAAVLLTLGILEELFAEGLAQGESALTESGHAKIKELRSVGFKPTMEETEAVIESLITHRI